MRTISLLFFSLSLLVLSCSRGFVYKVFNNSGQDIVVMSYDSASVLKSIPLQNRQARDVPFPSKLIIRNASRDWKYTLPLYRSEYEYTRAAGFRVQDVQIEPNGSIYLLLPKTTAPVAQFPPQPPNFPLTPQ